MRKKEAIELFGSVEELAKALNITRAAIYQWNDVVPRLRRFQIQELLKSQEVLNDQGDQETAA